MLSGVAVVATGVAVAGVVAMNDEEPAYGASAVTAVTAADTVADTKPVTSTITEGSFGDRVNDASRSLNRPSLESARKKQADQDAARRAANADPRGIARAMMPEFGFAASEFSCLDQLYVGESDWDMHADNPTSTAYGIPQALMSAHELPADYTTNATTQIRWGLGYIRDAYGSPCSALEFKEGNGYY